MERAPVSAAAGDRPGGVVSWFVRRAGLARCTTVAGAAGIALAAAFPGQWTTAILGLTLALAGLLSGHALGRLVPQARAALAIVLVSVLSIGVMAGFLVGTVRVTSSLDGGLPVRIGETVRAEVVVTSAVSVHSGWQSGAAQVVRMSSSKVGQVFGASETVWLEVAPPDAIREIPVDAGGSGIVAPILAQGARLSVTGTLAAPQGPSASGFDQAKSLLRQGIQVVLEVDSPSAVSYLGRRGGVSGAFDRLREAAKIHLNHGPDARVNAVLQGVVMGDTSGIDEGWMEAFRRSGTAHMLSVSGLHVACLAAIVIALAGFARMSRRAGFVLAAGAALLMVPFVGPSPPIIRSAAMMVVVLAGRLVGRRRDQWQGLAAAAVVVLAIDPFAVFDVGFQLSFSAFAGMVGLVRPLERALQRLPDAVRSNLAVSVAATLGTAPVSMIVFGRTSLISPLANLLVVPTLGAVTGLGMAAVILGFAWSGFSVALDTLASLPMMWSVLVSTVCSRAPVLEVTYIGMVMSGAAAAALALPAGLALCGRPVGAPWGVRLPGFSPSLTWLRRHRPPGRRWAAVVAVGIVMIAAGVGAAVYPAGTAGIRSVEYLLGGGGWPSQTEVRVLDVGQGTAVLVRTPDHHAALFDAGPEGCDLAGQLRSLGVKRLDLVVISHPHADHFAGLAEALDTVDVEVLVDRIRIEKPAPGGAEPAGGQSTVSTYYSSGGTEARQYLAMRTRLEEKGCHLVQAVPGATLAFHGTAVKLYAPVRPLALLDGPQPWGEGRSPPTGDELNGGSIVTLLEAGGARLLLPGDAEADALARYHLPAVDVLVVGHHGSRGAVSETLLDDLRVRLAVISVGTDNSFGHPDVGTLATLRNAGGTVLRTDRSGWVSFGKKDGTLAVSAERIEAS